VRTIDKVVTIDAAKKIAVRLRRQGKVVAFTNGCFDVLHYGHIHYLERAKKANRTLIVGLNSDSSVKKIKGPSRPIVPQKQRAALVAALACVDYVIIFNDATPYRIINVLKPDVLIKGADWKGKKVVGSNIVKSWGGKVELVTYLKAYSTTKLIASIKKKCRK